MAEDRIQLNTSIPGMIYAMSEGNPGATEVLAQLLGESGSRIDPDSAYGGFGTILRLDGLKIYGHRIWQLYKDVCGEHLGKMIAVLRANQLGLLGEEALNHAIDNYGDDLDVDTLAAKVQERLPNFQIEAATAAS